ncbi:MAG: arginine--tRNA ligase [Aminivibrio sp.]|jgi:arginyl-tRNA synthetase|nr:arginine--tRNA ligase [Synergistaceae bacterium]
MEGVEATLRQIVEGAVREAASEKGISLDELPEINFEKPKREGQGDLSTNCAMQMSKLLGEKPADLAKKIAAKLSASPYLDRVETAGPGFINFFLSPKWMGEVLEAILAGGGGWGSSNRGGGKRVQVEFVSANPTGPLHVGHGRGAAVGDIIANILAFTGWKVEREYYINDAGLQMDLLGASVRARYFELAGKGDQAPFPEDGYKGDYIYDVAEAVREQEGDRFLSAPPEEGLAFFKDFSGKAILDSIKKDLADFGVNFDVWFSEKTLYGQNLVPSAMETLKERGYAFEHEGALWFKSTDFTDEKDRVLIRANGAPTYFASDIAYHKNKFDRGFDRVIDVWGADHHGYVPRMKAGVQSLGRDPDDLDILLIQFVNLLRDGVQAAMSTRSGEFVTLADVVGEVGADAARFFFAMRRNDSHLDFDLELAKRTSNDNPVYYVQYAHARVCSVLREAEARGAAAPPAQTVRGDIFASAEEKKLLSRLADFPREADKASRELAPHILVKYVSDLAGDFHSFYNAHRILGEAEEVMGARLLLAKASGMVIASVLALLGVKAPERM